MPENAFASEFFGPWESVLESWSDFQHAANELTERYSTRQMVWRGTRQANWGVMSSLYRALQDQLERPPSENEMNAAEVRILELARNDWRFDGMPALETMAHLQHLGAPTRLLDVTANPLVALWFAVEQHAIDDGHDARLLAFVADTREIRLNDRWYSRDLRWHSLSTTKQRIEAKWGTGLGRRLWRPPAFNTRIAAQNAAFLIDGVPIDAPENGLGRQAPEVERAWNAEEMSLVSSMPLKLTQIRRGELPASAAPVFTYRIAAHAKVEIRDQLERRYGFRASSIYSDLGGLAEYLRLRPSLLTAATI
jgi:hypothetical protein